MTQVIRFDPNAYVVVFICPHSDVLQVTSNIADEAVAKMYAERIANQGGHVIRYCKAGVLVAALELIKGKEEA